MRELTDVEHAKNYLQMAAKYAELGSAHGIKRGMEFVSKVLEELSATTSAHDKPKVRGLSELYVAHDGKCKIWSSSIEDGKARSYKFDHLGEWTSIGLDFPAAFFSHQEDAALFMWAIKKQTAQPAKLPEWWPQFILNVCEIPDRNSPDNEPGAMIATADELERCALSAMERVL